MSKLESMEKARDKYKQLYELLESICRSNFEELDKWDYPFWPSKITKNLRQEVEEVILSDDEVNEREKRNG